MILYGISKIIICHVHEFVNIDDMIRICHVHEFVNIDDMIRIICHVHEFVNIHDMIRSAFQPIVLMQGFTVQVLRKDFI